MVPFVGVSHNYLGASWNTRKVIVSDLKLGGVNFCRVNNELLYYAGWCLSVRAITTTQLTSRWNPSSHGKRDEKGHTGP
eukprot:8988302-Pyramimonas_sp.AAC.1